MSISSAPYSYSVSWHWENGRTNVEAEGHKRSRASSEPILCWVHSRSLYTKFASWKRGATHSIWCLYPPVLIIRGIFSSILQQANKIGTTTLNTNTQGELRLSQTEELVRDRARQGGGAWARARGGLQPTRILNRITVLLITQRAQPSCWLKQEATGREETLVGLRGRELGSSQTLQSRGPTEEGPRQPNDTPCMVSTCHHHSHTPPNFQD